MNLTSIPPPLFCWVFVSLFSFCEGHVLKFLLTCFTVKLRFPSFLLPQLKPPGLSSLAFRSSFIHSFIVRLNGRVAEFIVSCCRLYRCKAFFPCPPPVLVVVGVCPPSPYTHSSMVFRYGVLRSNLAALTSHPWRGPYSIHDLDSVTVSPAMALRTIYHDPEFGSTSMPRDCPPQTQPAPSSSRSLLQNIKRRLADCEAAQAQRVSQLEHRIHNKIAVLRQ